MKAVVMEGVRQPLVVKDFPEPVIGPNDALVRVEACGVCRSDWHLWQGDLSWVGFELPIPCVLGHEWAGTVEAVGSGVEHIRPGMRVLTPFHNGCGNCNICRSGLPNICDTQGGFAGGFAQKAAIYNARLQRYSAAGQRLIRSGRSDGLPLHDLLSRRRRPRRSLRRRLGGGQRLCAASASRPCRLLRHSARR